MSPRLTRAAVGLALGASAVLVAAGCADSHEPNYLYRGEWIDIDGQGRSAEQTCGGSFEFLDSYAGALAREFGVEGHLGDYRWYSQERFEAEMPCPYTSGGCSWDDIVASISSVHAHELVHLAEYAKNASTCPDSLSEGLAEYYSIYPDDLKSDGFERVVAAFDDPTKNPPQASYGPLGRFAAFLVTRYGLDAVFDVCQASGRYPSAAELSAATDSVLGSTMDELLTEFEAELGPACNRGKDYESRVYACGVAEAAPDIGLIGEAGVELDYAIDCANERTIGPLGDRVFIIERFDLEFDGLWFIRIQSADADISDILVTISGCEPCGPGVPIQGEFVGPLSFDAGRHWLEVNAPADFIGTVTVRITP